MSVLIESPVAVVAEASSKVLRICNDKPRNADRFVLVDGRWFARFGDKWAGEVLRWHRGYEPSVSIDRRDWAHFKLMTVKALHLLGFVTADERDAHIRWAWATRKDTELQEEGDKLKQLAAKLGYTLTKIKTPAKKVKT